MSSVNRITTVSPQRSTRQSIRQSATQAQQQTGKRKNLD